MVKRQSVSDNFYQKKKEKKLKRYNEVIDKLKEDNKDQNKQEWDELKGMYTSNLNMSHKIVNSIKDGYSQLYRLGAEIISKGTTDDIREFKEKESIVKDILSGLRTTLSNIESSLNRVAVDLVDKDGVVDIDDIPLSFYLFEELNRIFIILQDNAIDDIMSVNNFISEMLISLDEIKNRNKEDVTDEGDA